MDTDNKQAIYGLLKLLQLNKQNSSMTPIDTISGNSNIFIIGMFFMMFIFMIIVFALIFYNFSCDGRDKNPYHPIPYRQMEIPMTQTHYVTPYGVMNDYIYPVHNKFKPLKPSYGYKIDFENPYNGLQYSKIPQGNSKNLQLDYNYSAIH